MNTDNLLPLGNNVAIRRDPAPDRTPAGLHLVTRQKPLRGTVVAVGPGLKAQPLKPGDRVEYTAMDTGVQEFDGVLITDADYVLCKFVEE